VKIQPQWVVTAGKQTKPYRIKELCIKLVIKTIGLNVITEQTDIVKANYFRNITWPQYGRVWLKSVASLTKLINEN
jgi:hypothetical protein